MINESQTHAKSGDLAQLVSAQNKRFTIRLVQDGQLHTHRGVLSHNDLIGLPWGSQINSHLGSPFILIQPTLSDILLDIKRNTQIMYPKEIGFILVTMGIGPGKHVLEAGTGSGSMTTALAYMVGPNGRVTSYEARPEMQRLAIKNLERVGLAERVTFRLGDIKDGFEESDIDAVFLDVPNPYDYMAQVKAALKPGGPFGTILPTTNQISTLLVALKREHFAFIEVCEIFLRFYKAVPERLRPTDRMVAHTGYLVFARSIIPGDEEIGQEIDASMDDIDSPEDILPESDL
ncbi:MAG: tRNA (adenine-N1)-methyltransferase [Chloroflexi bacterium RBG_19FT_COMBO_49_13]|nr:MAG: tRNA (adenine-N1)-methyltransferase [Chloroflexi bacterium RBG_19FT_COMBO_49_13]